MLSHSWLYTSDNFNNINSHSQINISPHIHFFLILVINFQYQSYHNYFFEMLSSSSKLTSKLLLQLVFFTAKSARQTTPNLIKNPRLTSRGILERPSKSYAYDLPQELENRHLYWNNTVQNRIRRKQYNAYRLYKLGVRPIHDQNGAPLHNREVKQILYELSNLRLLKQSLGRTLINLRQIAQQFPQTMQGEDRFIVLWALDQVHDRNLSSMTHYQFSTYCYLRKSLRVPATATMLVHLYKLIEGEVEAPTNKIKPRYFLQNMHYIFKTAPVEQENILLYKQERQFKLFEDVMPQNKPLLEILPKLFTDAQIQSLKHEGFDPQVYNFLLKIPGGKGLYERIKSG